LLLPVESSLRLSHKPVSSRPSLNCESAKGPTFGVARSVFLCLLPSISLHWYSFPALSWTWLAHAVQRGVCCTLCQLRVPWTDLARCNYSIFDHTRKSFFLTNFYVASNVRALILMYVASYIRALMPLYLVSYE